ncbi:CoA-binding protein [bacterium]|nr:CoA-binding protein [bacterium]
MRSIRDDRPTVAVIGASRDRSRFGNISVRAHRQKGYQVFPINPHAAEIEGLPAFASLSELPVKHLDRMTVYVPADVGLALLDEIAAFDVNEVWFNPGSCDARIRARAAELGLKIIEACSIVDLGISPGSV